MVGKQQKTPSRRTQQPRIVEIPAQKMAVVTTTGDPNVVAEQAFPALFGAFFVPPQFDMGNLG